MAYLHHLSPEGIREAIGILIEGNLSIALTVRYQTRWVTFRTRALAGCGPAFWVEMPHTDHLPTPYEFKPGERLGVTFTVAQRRYVFATRVICAEIYQLDETSKSTALKLAVPDEMRKIERRLHARLDLSHEEMTRATFWLGGRDACPAEASFDAPIWSGRILNISGGGLLVRTTYEAAKYVEVGDIVGAHILLGKEEQPVFVDAQVRHCSRDGEMALIGLQFIEIEEAPENRAAVEMIRRKIAEQIRRPKEAAAAG